MTTATRALADMPTRWGHYEFGRVFARTDPDLFSTWFRRTVLRSFVASFITSQGRQYAQLCDLTALVALLQRHHGPHAVDWGFLLSRRTLDAIRAWPLPGAHTRSPERTEGQVAGLYHFWWLNFLDVFHARHFGAELPNNDALDERMHDECGVSYGVTSSSNEPEMCTVRDGYQRLRDDPDWATATPEVLVRRHVTLAELKAAQHWVLHRRPTLATPGCPRPDRHALPVRGMILSAEAKPEAEHHIYDRWAVLLGQGLDTAAQTPGPGAPWPVRHAHYLYRDVLDRYNAHHPDAPITILHR